MKCASFILLSLHFGKNIPRRREDNRVKINSKLFGLLVLIRRARPAKVKAILFYGSRVFRPILVFCRWTAHKLTERLMKLQIELQEIIGSVQAVC